MYLLYKYYLSLLICQCPPCSAGLSLLALLGLSFLLRLMWVLTKVRPLLVSLHFACRDWRVDVGVEGWVRFEDGVRFSDGKVRLSWGICLPLKHHHFSFSETSTLLSLLLDLHRCCEREMSSILSSPMAPVQRSQLFLSQHYLQCQAQHQDTFETAAFVLGISEWRQNGHTSQ